MYSVDWIGKEITIPTSDLVLVSGTRYKLLMSDFLIEIRRLEAGFDDGLWAPQILDHTNPKLDFAGADYAGFDDISSDYTIIFSAPATRVDLIGSNNNIIDVLTATGVSVVPSNSAGLQLVTVETGTSGLTTEESDALIQIAADTADINIAITAIEGDIATVQTDIGTINLDISSLETDVAFMKAIEAGEWHIVANQMIFYNELAVEIARFDLKNASGDPAMVDVYRRVPV